MSLAPFAQHIARVNSVVMARLADAVVSIDGGVPFGALFEDPYAGGAVGGVGMASVAPVLVVAESLLPAAPVGLPLMVNGRPYRIDAVEPDGNGFARLALAEVYTS